eukprot:TRINITY_DN3983_c0_g1_i2.p1 TRINITY_DN3983_c0_g1~~TRINITY_DN3983_c0_g1_i2.p1  ORF type:complete len:355 (+),score=74.50 TRINITY_DN3983_c0_g1_i2:151-1065(+)
MQAMPLTNSTLSCARRAGFCLRRSPHMLPKSSVIMAPASRSVAPAATSFLCRSLSSPSTTPRHRPAPINVYQMTTTACRTLSSSPSMLKNASGSKRPASQSVTDEALDPDYRLVASVILERYPVMPKELEEFEQNYIDFKKKRDDLLKPQNKKESLEGASQDEGGFGKKKGGDRTLKDYYPKSRVSKADTEGDHHSLDRTLDGRLFLVLKKSRAEHKWQFPQAPRQKGETMREAAEASLAEECGTRVKSYFISNAPSSHIEYDYTPEEQKRSGLKGAKVFFYRAEYRGGPLRLRKDAYEDYAWC